MELFRSSKDFSKRKKADILVIPFCSEKEKPVSVGELLKHPLNDFIQIHLGDFKGKEGEIALAYNEKIPEKRIALLGLGSRDKLSTESLRRAYGCLGKFCQARKLASVNLLLPSKMQLDELCMVRGIAEGLLHVNYLFLKWKGDAIQKDPPVLLKEVNLIGVSNVSLNYVRKLSAVFEGVYLARDLVNDNADVVTPQYLEAVAKEIAKKHPRQITAKLLSKKEIQKEKLNLLLAVNQGSSRDPAFIIMHYHGDPRSKDNTVIVGKGITYDTGGLNLKPTGSMETMKGDMGAAAACLGLLQAAVNVGLKRNFTIVIPSTENSIDSKSLKPGDVIRTAIGKTVEIDNTDAEGRLVLADGLIYSLKHLSPTRLIDLGTLTGAMVVSLGEEVTGMMSNDDQFAETFFEAGELTFERVWRFPIYDEYRENLKSDIADFKNVGGRAGGSINCALFIKEFVGSNIPWVHLDIAGTSYLSRDRRYLPKNGTGVGVRLILELLELL